MFRPGSRLIPWAALAVFGVMGRRFGLALAQLAGRGIEAGPPPSSLFDLLTSDYPDRRGLGMTLLMSLHPEIWSRIADGSTNLDPPEA